MSASISRLGLEFSDDLFIAAYRPEFSEGVEPFNLRRIRTECNGIEGLDNQKIDVCDGFLYEGFSYQEIKKLTGTYASVDQMFQVLQSKKLPSNHQDEHCYQFSLLECSKKKYAAALVWHSKIQGPRSKYADLMRFIEKESLLQTTHRRKIWKRFLEPKVISKQGLERYLSKHVEMYGDLFVAAIKSQIEALYHSDSDLFKRESLNPKEIDQSVRNLFIEHKVHFISAENVEAVISKYFKVEKEVYDAAMSDIMPLFEKRPLVTLSEVKAIVIKYNVQFSPMHFCRPFVSLSSPNPISLASQEESGILSVLNSSVEAILNDLEYFSLFPSKIQNAKIRTSEIPPVTTASEERIRTITGCIIELFGETFFDFEIRIPLEAHVRKSYLRFLYAAGLFHYLHTQNPRFCYKHLPVSPERTELEILSQIVEGKLHIRHSKLQLL